MIKGMVFHNTVIWTPSGFFNLFEWEGKIFIIFHLAIKTWYKLLRLSKHETYLLSIRKKSLSALECCQNTLWHFCKHSNITFQLVLSSYDRIYLILCTDFVRTLRIIVVLEIVSVTSGDDEERREKTCVVTNESVERGNGKTLA